MQRIFYYFEEDMKKVGAIKKSIPPKKVSVQWIKLVQFFLGLFISWLGIQKLTYYPQNWWYGVIAQSIAGYLILYSFPKSSAVLEWEGNKQPKNKSGDKKAKKSASWVLAAILVLLGLSSYEFYGDNFYLGSFFALLVIGLVIFAKKQNVANELERADFDFSEEKWFWTLMVFAAILRFAFVGTNLTGLQGDEGNNLTDTIGIGGGHYSPFETAWGGTPILPYYYYVILFKIFGAKLWVARLGTSFASLGAIYFF